MLINKECRICLQNTDKKFLSPCLCSGTSKYVHEDCLYIWRTTSLNREAYHRCMECRAKYRTKKLHKSEGYFISLFNIKERIKLVKDFFVLTFGISSISLLLSVNDIQLNIFKNRKLIRILKNYKSLNFCYNYSLFSFLILFCTDLIFYKQCYNNVKRKEQYYALIGNELILYFLINAHFFFFYAIIAFACDDPKTFIIVEQCISPFSLVSNILIYERHNNVLKSMNNEYNFDIVVDYLPNTNENIIIDITD